ncbi:hypothetical protein QW180_31520 [Vibrio sinaloensis]|nr:hypothetical protein [Vibrio sinaloensis]
MFTAHRNQSLNNYSMLAITTENAFNLYPKAQKDKLAGQKNIQRHDHSLKAWVDNIFLPPEQRHSVHSLINGHQPFTNKDVIIIDDANKMSAKELIAVADKAKQSNSKVMLLNRSSNRQSFKSHNAIDLFSKGNVEHHSWVSNKKNRDSEVHLHDNDTSTIARVYSELPDKSNTQVIATSSVEQRRLTDAIRGALKNTGELSRVETTLFTQTPHYLSESQKSLVQHYKPGMTLTHWIKKNRPHSFVIASVDTERNIMTALNKKRR